jgi:serine/threonine-protein kinase
MGVVYSAAARHKRHRALKLMLPQLLLDDDMRARFTREGIVTAGIESEHLVEVFDVGIDQQTRAPFLVMELLRGEDLGARLTRGERTTPAEVLEIVAQLARALDKTHTAGVVHRDLKPENLFVTQRDDGSMRMRILDFGIAKLVERTGVARGKDTRSVGTPLYMAPEQMTGLAIDIGPAADIYALGHIVFTLLVGSPYFRREAESADNVLGLMFKVSGGTVEPASFRAANVGVALPESFDAWFSKATKLDPTLRFASAGELLRAPACVNAPDLLPTVGSLGRGVVLETIRLDQGGQGARPTHGQRPVHTPMPLSSTNAAETGPCPQPHASGAPAKPRTGFFAGRASWLPHRSRSAATVGGGAGRRQKTGVATVSLRNKRTAAQRRRAQPEITIGAPPSTRSARRRAQPTWRCVAASRRSRRRRAHHCQAAGATGVPTMWGRPRR